MMSSLACIFKREFRSYFSTPIALIFLTVFLILAGIFTFKMGSFFERGHASLDSFFVWHPWLYLFLIPAVSMRLWAEERRSGTIELLLTLPMSTLSIVLGKFFAAWIFIGTALLLTFPIFVTVVYLGDPDCGVILVNYIGSFLMAGAFLSIGIFISSLTSNQVISFIVTSVICLILILLGFNPVIETLKTFLPLRIVEFFVQLSFPSHFASIRLGVIELRDLVYFCSVITFGLFSSVISIERLKGGER